MVFESSRLQGSERGNHVQSPSSILSCSLYVHICSSRSWRSQHASRTSSAAAVDGHLRLSDQGFFDYFSFDDALAVLQPGFANAFGWCLSGIVTEYSDGMGRRKFLYDKSRTLVAIPACKATQLMLSHSEPHGSFRCGQQTVSHVIIATSFICGQSGEQGKVSAYCFPATFKSQE